MRILQIKQVECALADGRLDEACELIVQGDLRSHRQGQELLGRLVRGLLARAAEHLAAGHTRQALDDCQKAAELGGNLPEAAELRARIAEAIACGQRDRQREGDLVAAARRHVEDGRLSMAEALLADADADSARAETLRREAASRRSAAEAALVRAEAALVREDHATAIDELLTARAHQACRDALAELTARAVSDAARRARSDLARGRLDLAESLLERLRPLAGGRTDVTDLAGAVQQCRRAWSAVGRGEFRRAAEALRLAQCMVAEAAWLRDAVAAAEEAARTHEALRAGPLAMLSGAGSSWNDAVPEASGEEEQPGVRPMELSPVDEGPAGDSGLLPRQFLLRVDGAGCSMVVREDRVTIGPISSPQRPDLGLLADPAVPVVMIERTEGDYFLRSEAPVEVNDRPTTSRLLADGDKIGLSPRCRLRFRLPSAASASAVLEFSTARLPQADVRRVVLMDREVILGPDAAAHIRAEGLADRAVLHLRAGRLMVRTEAELTVGRKPLPPAAGLPLDTPVRIGPVGLVVSRA